MTNSFHVFDICQRKKKVSEKNIFCCLGFLLQETSKRRPPCLHCVLLQPCLYVQLLQDWVSQKTLQVGKGGPSCSQDWDTPQIAWLLTMALASCEAPIAYKGLWEWGKARRTRQKLVFSKKVFFYINTKMLPIATMIKACLLI